MGSEPRFEPRPELTDLPVLQKFKLYRTRSNFYLIGSDKKKSFWRILKIDRTDPTELNLFEDPHWYTNDQMRELISCISETNKEYGGLATITTCYGLIGFVKFLEPYYMLVITKRKKVGEICGHTIYGIAESKMIMIPHLTYQTKLARSEDEKRYEKLLNMVDLRKNFYFSYTYHIMYNLQKNISNTVKGQPHDDTMFVWNAFLTRKIRTTLQNTIWTVALIYGFFQQTICSVSDEEFVLIVIARRSRHYAGTRYLRRGVNDKGRVANEVETEQIVSKMVPEGHKIPIVSVVQVRGSIPLFWSQETSVFKPQPEIIINKRDATYKAARYHFENLRQRYGKRIVILNLLKVNKKRHRETILWEEFVKAIRVINILVRKENRLKAIHFDLSKHHKSGAEGAFRQLRIFAEKALEWTGLFFCKAPSGVGAEDVIHESFFNNPLAIRDEEANSVEDEALKPDILMFQDGVLRTNCIDCLDRTNFAQYAHGLVALEKQLHTLGITGPPVFLTDNPLALKLMETYQNMGDTIAMQYGGSGAHSKMFVDLRGDWNMMKHLDLITSARRHLSNAYQDGPKQNAINVFLGHFRPQLGNPALWELDSDMHNIGRKGSYLDLENIRIRRSFSDNLLMDGDLNLEELALGNPQPSREVLDSGISETNLDFSFYENEAGSLSFQHNLKEGSSQMFPGSTSYSDSQKPDDIPGFSHSYKTKFTPAEEIYQFSSTKSWSSDDIFSEVGEFSNALSKTKPSFEFLPRSREDSLRSDEATSFSNIFTRWVECGKTL